MTDLFAGIYDGLRSTVTGVGDLFDQATEALKFQPDGTGSISGALKDGMKNEVKLKSIPLTEGDVRAGTADSNQPGKTSYAKGANYENLEQRWLNRISAFGGGAKPMEGLKSVTDPKASERALKRILTEGN